MPPRTRSREVTEELEQDRRQALDHLLEDNQSARVMMGQLREQVDKRVQAQRAELEAFDEIARLASELRRAGVEQSVLASEIKRLDRTDRNVKSISRQALNLLITQREQRHPTRTPPRRRRRKTGPGGGVNLDALL
jgi:chemotaxis response regulator CheB